MKTKIVVAFIFVFIVLMVLFDTTVAYPSKLFINTNVIENTDNKEELYNNIYSFIEKNDDLLIALSSYELSDILSNNYDFLKRYAVNYIIDNINDYENKINNNYISVDEIYKITDNVFGKNYFYINDLNKVELVKDDRRFRKDIRNLKVDNNGNYVSVIVNYGDISYKFILLEKEDRLIVENIEVL